MASGKRTALSVAQVVIALLVIAGGIWLIVKLVGYHQGQQVYRDIEAAYANQGSSSESPVNFAAMQEEYSNVVGWLKMDDVDISYPIVQGENNEQYLYCDPANRPSVDGSIFLDYRNKSLDSDLYALVYGHNMRDESMFGQLDEYTSEEFYQRGTGAFTISTPKGSYRYKIFAVNIVDPSDDVYQTGFSNAQAFETFVEQLQYNSMYDTGVEVSGSDHVVTLSTCSDTNRLVLSAKRL